MMSRDSQGVVAVIPARGGSKGVVRKNLRLVGGVPLVVHAIRAALGAEMVDRTVVSTDDHEIADVSRRAGAEVLLRDPELASDTAPIMPVLNRVLDQIEEKGFSAKIVVLVEPTSPLRRAEHVDACLEKLMLPDTESVVTVTQLERNPNNIFKVEGDMGTRLLSGLNAFVRRQEFQSLKRINGCVYATYAKNIRDGSLVKDPVRIIEMNPEESVHVDTELDLEIAKLCLRILRKKKAQFKASRED